MRKITQSVELKIVQCEPKYIYLENPFDTTAQAATSGSIKEFIDSLYPMPFDAPSPMLWNYRCDYLYKEFQRLHGMNHDEHVFWATFKQFLPYTKCVKWVFDESAVREVKTATGKEKQLWKWKEHSYEVRGVGYNGRPKDPRTME